jgi:ATP-dependent Lhr-like helicase
MEVEVVVPIEDMAEIGRGSEGFRSGPAAAGPERVSIWPAIHPQLLELIRAHSSTLIFVNARRLAERLASRLNELAGEDLVRAHHGSIAREQRLEIEDRLKQGTLRGLVATSSLELGIDMGAVDLVIQVESPGSVARGLQRIGRAGHQVGEPSRGKVFPKYRGDLLEATVVVRRMFDGLIEETRYPRNRSTCSRSRRRDVRDGRVDRDRAGRADPPRRELRRAVRGRPARGARPALGTVPLGRVR